MKCFHFNNGEKREEVGDDAVASRTSKVSWARSFSVASSNLDTRRSEFDSESRDFSDSVNFYEFLSQRRSNNLRVFSFEEMKSATRGFSRALMIGEGGFGCVYQGVISVSEDDCNDITDSTIDVAIKQLNRNGLQGHKEWINEVNCLGVVSHPNLVKLVGYCADDDERGMQRLLVYELMRNKSLESHLLSRVTSSPLPWTTRLKIAQDAARGLAYLHEEMDFQHLRFGTMAPFGNNFLLSGTCLNTDLSEFRGSCIEETETNLFPNGAILIFRDFKTSNILLDNDFNAKLSDFGLARQGPTAGLSHVFTTVVGTVGYAAPEYVHTGKLTTKSDVWSFGVVLFELITGRRAVERNLPRSEQKLLGWVKPFLSDSKKFHQIIDPRLEGNYCIKSAHKVASLANKCLTKHPKHRPKMSEVVETLGDIINQIVIANEEEEEEGKPISTRKKVFFLREMMSLRNKHMAMGMLDWRSWSPRPVRT